MRYGDIMAIVLGREEFPARNYIVMSECAERVEQNIYAGIIVMKRNRESSPRIICQVATVGFFYADPFIIWNRWNVKSNWATARNSKIAKTE